MKTFRLAPGFRVELVAAEPLVQDPVVIAFDAPSRLSYYARLGGQIQT